MLTRTFLLRSTKIPKDLTEIMKILTKPFFIQKLFYLQRLQSVKSRQKFTVSSAPYKINTEVTLLELLLNLT